MLAIASARPRARSISPLHLILAGLTWLVARSERRQVRRTLHRLSDHELADIGMPRGAIDRLG